MRLKSERQKAYLGLQDDPALATVAGLALAGVDFDDEPGILGLTKGWSYKAKGWFRNFIP